MGRSRVGRTKSSRSGGERSRSKIRRSRSKWVRDKDGKVKVERLNWEVKVKAGKVKYGDQGQSGKVNVRCPRSIKRSSQWGRSRVNGQGVGRSGSKRDAMVKNRSVKIKSHRRPMAFTH